MNPSEAFRANVARLLSEKGLTAAAMTEAVGMRSTGWASMLLAGTNDAPIKTAARIAEFLEVPLWELFIPPAEGRKRPSRSPRVLPVDPAEERLVLKYRALSARNRAAIESVIEAMTAQAGGVGKRAQKRRAER